MENYTNAAVCEMQKKRVSVLLFLESENYDREFYTGFFLGELNFTTEKERNQNRRNVENGAYRFIKKHTELFVNLRCVKLTGTTASIYVAEGNDERFRP